MCKGDMNHREPKNSKIILLGRVDTTNWYVNQFVLSTRPSKMIFAVFRFMMIHIAFTHCYKLESSDVRKVQCILTKLEALKMQDLTLPDLTLSDVTMTELLHGGSCWRQSVTVSACNWHCRISSDCSSRPKPEGVTQPPPPPAPQFNYTSWIRNAMLY